MGNQEFKRGNRVRYVGNTTLSLAGLVGTITKLRRDGWIMVRFDGDTESRPIAQHNLKKGAL